MSRARDIADLAGSADAGGLTGRNLIINGAMQVAQRGASSTSSGYQTVDRIATNAANTDELAFTQSQSTTVPSGQGFANSFKVEVTTAETTLAADENFRITYKIEAQNLQHLAYGNSSAKSLTLSFWVRSSLTGKYSVLFYQDDAVRSNTPSFTISTADTWEYKTITIDGDTGGTINDDNGAGININWVLAAGTDVAGTPHTGWGAYTATDDFAHDDQVNFIAQTGTFYLTGVQLEVGQTATPFEHEGYGTTLEKCRRFYQKITTTIDFHIVRNTGNSDTLRRGTLIFSPEMRASPTAAITSDNSGGTVSTLTTTASGFRSTVTANSTGQVYNIAQYTGDAEL